MRRDGGNVALRCRERALPSTRRLVKVGDLGDARFAFFRVSIGKTCHEDGERLDAAKSK